jgi:hypothetical protein
MSFRISSIGASVLLVLTILAWSPTFKNGLVSAQTINKTSVQVRLQVHKGFKGDPETWSWTPVINFRVNGPFSPGGALSVEYALPGKTWKFDCQVEDAGPGWLGARDCGQNPPEDQAVTYTGLVDLKINFRNELEGKSATLLTGKFKVDKFHEGVVDLPKFKNNFVYYVNYDWVLPIAYVYDEWIYNWEYAGALNRYGTTVPNMSRSHLMAAFSFRGTNKSVIYSKYAAYLYYKGQMVAEAVPESAVCEILNTPETNQDSTNAYCRSVFSFQKAMLWDKEPTVMEPGFYYEMYKNPGEYEIKVLQNGKLARTAKFTFGSDYKIVDTGIAKQNNLGTLRVVIPVQIIGEQDGQWDRNAYKTDAFYGNPLTGFIAP